MPATETWFFILLFLGIALLLVGIVWTRVRWRPDIPPYGLHTRILDVTFHPENYASNAPLRTIRNLNIVAMLLLAGAMVLVIYEILRVIYRS